MKSKEEKFEAAISYILISGVALSLIILVAGLGIIGLQTGSLNSDYSSEWQLTGKSFFVYAGSLFSSFNITSSPTLIMALGIVVLMLTPYIRVLASVIYFGRIRDFKYLSFTLFVLTVLTLSLVIR